MSMRQCLKNGDPPTRVGRRKRATNHLRRRLPSRPSAPIPSNSRVVGSGTAEAPAVRSSALYRVWWLDVQRWIIGQRKAVDLCVSP